MKAMSTSNYNIKMEEIQVKEIEIQKITLSNFKACGALTLELSGKNAAIYGDNATGKTTVYDGLTWLLFGKDSSGSSDQETIKPLDADGNVKDHAAVTTVEAVLTVCGDGGTGVADSSISPRSAQNDRTVTLRKEMKESWVTRRGSSAPVYDGNDFNYYWDGVPLKKNEYTRRVAELVDEDVFKMLTSVTAFATDLPWRKRREILYDLSGVQTMSDKLLLMEAAKEARDGSTGERIATSPAAYLNDNAESFEHLAEQIGGGMTLDELKKVLTARRRGLMQTRYQTPARIDELQKQLNNLQIIDFSGAEELLRHTEAALREIDGKIALAKAGKSNPDLERRGSDLRAERSNLEVWKADELCRIGQEQDAVRAEIRNLYDQNLLHRRAQEATLPNEEVLRRELASLEQRKTNIRDGIADRRDEANGLDKLLNDARAEWVRVSEEEFTGATCPTCGQELPFEMLEDARKKFEANKAERLGEIQDRGNRHLLRAKKLRAQADNMETELQKLLPDVRTASEALEMARSTTNAVNDMEGYREQMDALNRKLAAISTSETLSAYQAKLADISRREALLNAETDKTEKALEDSLKNLNGKREELYNQQQNQLDLLRKRSNQDYLESRIDDLKKTMKQSAGELEDIDRDLFAMEAFVRWKTHYIEDSINGLFRIVTFRLFRGQANGGLEERCDVVVGGVPYAALNNGAKINAGMDIIRRLSEHYAVRVPLFVDNAESVTRLEDAGTQVIRLVVSEQDKSLRVEV